MMKKVAIFVLVLCFAASAYGQNEGITKKDLTSVEIDRIIKKFTENEGKFHEALKDYVFNRFANVNTIGMGGQVTGVYRRDSFMTFNQDGSRFEKVLFAPVETTPPGMVTPEDLEDLGGVNPFALEPSMVSQYNFLYVGMEHIDELNFYVFDVTPKVIPDPKKSKLRLFTGRIWVEKDDLMIVKSKGKAVPPTLVIAGELDPLMRADQVEAAVMKAKKDGLAVEWRMIKGRGHTLVVGEQLESAVDWLLRHKR